MRKTPDQPENGEQQDHNPKTLMPLVDFEPLRHPLLRHQQAKYEQADDEERNRPMQGDCDFGIASCGCARQLLSLLKFDLNHDFDIVRHRRIFIDAKV